MAAIFISNNLSNNLEHEAHEKIPAYLSKRAGLGHSTVKISVGHKISSSRAPRIHMVLRN